MDQEKFLVDKGLSAFYKNDYHAAVAALAEARIHNPNNPDVLHGLAGAFYTMGDYRQALQIYIDFVERFPDNLAAHEGAGLTYNRLGNKKAALREFRTLSRLAPNDPIPYTSISMLYREAKHYEAAHKELEAARRIASNHLNVYLEQGALAVAEGKMGDALRYYEAAVSLNPDNHYALSRLGYYYLETKQYQDARLFFGHALETRSKSPDALYGLALAEIGQRQWQDGIKTLHRVISISPGFRQAYITLSRTQIRVFQLRDAWKTFTELIEFDAN